MSKPNIIIIGNMLKAGVPSCIEKMRNILENQVNILGEFPLEALRTDNSFQDEKLFSKILEAAKNAQFCFVVGGDGTLLSAARTLAPSGIPLLGVNMGKLGYLAEYSLEGLRDNLAKVLTGEVKPQNRMMLQVHVKSSNGEPIFTSLAANEIAISAGHPFRMIDLQVSQGQMQVARYLGDGIILSTPTGSTGYNMAAGGPILQPTLKAFILTPIAPHALSLRPMVLEPHLPLSITPRSLNIGTSIIVDGQLPHKLCEGETIDISPASCDMQIVPHPHRAWFKILSTKLQYGLSPHHQDESQNSCPL